MSGAFLYQCAELRTKIKALTTALEFFLDDEPCRLDHHGYCQTHNLMDPCEQILAREAIEAAKENL